MYALIEKGVVARYPYSVVDLCRANPGTSFPSQPSDALLAEWGMQKVAQVQRPEENYTNNVVETTPQNINGVWTQVWSVTSASDDELAERTQRQEDQVRAERNSKLSASDWTQVADAPVDKTVWATYRQELRDLTTQAGFPWNVTWPAEP